MLAEMGRNLDVKIVEGHDPADRPGAGQITDGVDDQPAVLKVRQGENFVNRLPRPRLVEELLGREQEYPAAFLFAADKEPVALVIAGDA